MFHSLLSASANNSIANCIRTKSCNTQSNQIGAGQSPNACHQHRNPCSLETSTNEPSPLAHCMGNVNCAQILFLNFMLTFNLLAQECVDLFYLC